MKLLFVLAAMVCIIPLAVWGGTGRIDRAVQALREYLIAMAVIVVPVVVVASIYIAPSLFGW
jgi:hypothetical protein